MNRPWDRKSQENLGKKSRANSVGRSQLRTKPMRELEEGACRAKAANTADAAELYRHVCFHDALSHHQPAHSAPWREEHVPLGSHAPYLFLL